MSSTLLELTRASHEEVERLERLIVKDFQHEPTSNRERLFQNHRVRNMIESITFTTHKLAEIYEDKDNARKEEIAALGGQTATGTNVFSAFYDRLKEHTPLEKMDRKHFAKGSRVVEQNGMAAVSKQPGESKQIALMELKMKRLCELLNEIIAQTKENIEKKQALTFEEMEAEREEEEIQAESESDDDEQQIYNPLKLPMGWDGMGSLFLIGYTSSMVLDSYWGRRAFERHFK